MGTTPMKLKTMKSSNRIAKTPSDPLAGTNGQLMVLAAHRYCLGRQSYIVGSCQEWLTAYWTQFETGTQQVIVRDTVEALMEGTAGSSYDVITWVRFGQWAFDQLDDKSRSWVKNTTMWRQKPWPLAL
jgi:hypothetical protein